MRRGHARLWIEVVCWLTALLSFAVYAGSRVYGEFERRQAVAAFGAGSMPAVGMVGAALAVAPDADASSVASSLGAEPIALDQRNWSPARVRHHRDALQSPDNEQGAPVALLRMRGVGLEVPIYQDASERNLNRGAGLVAGTAAPGSDGNVAIAAHRDGYFRVLQDVALGDVLELETASQRRRYRVSALTVVAPTDISPLAATSAPAVTLVTCYPFYFVGSAPQRYIVRALAMP
jgi:sortase A